MFRRCMLIVGALGVWAILGAEPAHAQLFGNWFRKSPPPPPPAQRVSELVGIVRTDSDERKRTSAVEELRNFDTKAFPEIVPVLAEAAIKDTKPGVRAEAINSLVRIRPISNIAGQAIEGASQHDEYWRNRMSAQTALVRYRMAGYVSPPTPPPAPTPPQNAKGTPPAVKPPPQTGEPPLADAAGRCWRRRRCQRRADPLLRPERQADRGAERNRHHHPGADGAGAADRESALVGAADRPDSVAESVRTAGSLRAAGADADIHGADRSFSAPPIPCRQVVARRRPRSRSPRASRGADPREEPEAAEPTFQPINKISTRAAARQLQ